MSKNSNGYLSVSYSKFTAVLFKGMQEQQKQLKQQRTKNRKQAQQIAELQRRLNKLEQNERRMAGLPWAGTAVLLALILVGRYPRDRKNNS